MPLFWKTAICSSDLQVFMLADDCLVLGTSSGYLQIHSPTGQLLHRQDVHDSPLVSIALRWGG